MGISITDSCLGTTQWWLLTRLHSNINFQFAGGTYTLVYTQHTKKQLANVNNRNFIIIGKNCCKYVHILGWSTSKTSQDIISWVTCNWTQTCNFKYNTPSNPEKRRPAALEPGLSLQIPMRNTQWGWRPRKDNNWILARGPSAKRIRARK